MCYGSVYAKKSYAICATFENDPIMFYPIECYRRRHFSSALACQSDALGLWPSNDMMEGKKRRFNLYLCVCLVRIVTVYRTPKEKDITPRDVWRLEWTESMKEKKNDWKKKKIISYHKCIAMTFPGVYVCKLWSTPCEWLLPTIHCYLRWCNLFFKPLLIFFPFPHPIFRCLVHFFTAESYLW